jgi:DnaJ-class molecular chaperone
VKICAYCHGHGYTEREDKDGNIGEIMCPYCNGYGYEQEDKDDEAHT